MRHTNRRFMFIALALISVLLVFTLTACGSDDSYPVYSGGDVSDPTYGEDDEKSSFLDKPMTAERARKFTLLLRRFMLRMGIIWIYTMKKLRRSGNPMTRMREP